MDKKKFIAKHLHTVLSCVITFSVIIILWCTNILQTFAFMDDNFLITCGLVIVEVCVLGVFYILVLMITEIIFDKFTAMYAYKSLTGTITNKRKEEYTYFYRTGNMTYPRHTEDFYIDVQVDGINVSVYVYLDTYEKLTIGDTVEIQQEDTYRLGVYIYTSYYFVKKIK